MDTYSLRRTDISLNDVLVLTSPRAFYVRDTDSMQRLNPGDLVRVVHLRARNIDLELPDGGIALGCSLESLSNVVVVNVKAKKDTTKWAERRRM